MNGDSPPSYGVCVSAGMSWCQSTRSLSAGHGSANALELLTGVAVAFPRSPFVTAATAWELREVTGGKVRVGLGTQVRSHAVRRTGIAFEHPGPRLCDYGWP
jgi:alkanesulfonate monooxygenase SsuD/methylene tetrahydromethanopterin reductase-like flavin-dependent oxidoreductase (luciferase family)